MTPIQSAKFPKHHPSLFHVARAVAQNINNLVWTTVEWDTQHFDLLEEMLIVNPWTFTPLYAGYYHLHSSIRITGLNPADTFEGLIFATVIGVINDSYAETTNAGEDIFVHLDVVRYLTPNNPAYVQVRHNFGAARAIGGAWAETLFYGHRIG